MSNYTKTTNFASKDNLSPGNPLKIVKGTEIDTEFNNIQTAVGTKTDNSAAAITGGSITGITDLAVADGGTGASTATAALNNLLPTQTGNANKYLQTDGTNATWDAVSLSTSDITGTLPVANGGTGVTTSTGTGAVVLSNSPTLVTPALGTPASGTATNLTGLPISTGVSGLGTGVATFLGTPSSANLASAVTDETGSGALVFANSPTLVTPALGTPSALVGTNITGTASGLTAGNVTTNANLTGAITSTGNATSLGSFSSANLLGALTDETGTGSAVFATSPTLVTPILGTPTSATLTNATGLPISTGVSGLGTGVATALAVNVGSSGAPLVNGGVLGTPSSGTATNLTGLPLSTGVTGTLPVLNGGTGVTTSTGSGNNVLSTSPTLVTPVLGTPTSATLTNATGLPLTTGVTGTLPVANGGTGQTTYTDGQLLIGNSTGNTLTKATLTAGTNITITNAAGAITIAASGGGSSQWTTSGSDIYYNTGAVSVGTSTPLLTASGRGNVTINGSGNSILVLANGGTTSGYMFGDASSLGFSAGSGTNSRVMTFDTNGSERMRIDSSGNLGLGVTPTATSSAGIFQNQGGILWAYSNLFQDLTQNAYYNGGYKYSVTSYAATMYRQQGGSHQWYTSPTGTAGNAITFTQSLAVGKGTTLALEGASSQTGTGITFPATQSASTDANTLDDYEEGTWTPTLGGTSTYSIQSGRYRKIGALCTIDLAITVSSIGTGSSSQISGLPFTALSGSTSASGAIGYAESLATNIIALTFRIDSGGTVIANTVLTTAANSTSSGVGIFGNGARVLFSITYLTA